MKIMLDKTPTALQPAPRAALRAIEKQKIFLKIFKKSLAFSQKSSILVLESERKLNNAHIKPKYRK